MPALAPVDGGGHIKEVRSEPDAAVASETLPSPARTRPMLARLARDLPLGDFSYEPKWDGLRALAFVSGEAAPTVDIRSRHGRPLARYFPEIVEALAAVPKAEEGSDAALPVVLDGEIVVPTEGGFDFGALLGRIHPAASRVERLRHESPARLVVFDLLAAGGASLLQAPFAERRARLARLFSSGPRGALSLTPATDDPALALRWLEAFHGRGIDGIVAKDRGLTYQPGRRAMVKVKREATVDCVVAGVRVAVVEEDCGAGSPARRTPVTASLLLGLYDGSVLRHVGVASSFTDARRRELIAIWAPLAAGPEGHPWQHGFNVGRSPMGRLPGAAGRWDPGEMERDWIPLRPALVCEVAYDQRDGTRFRHPARFVRWRPDRDPRSCALDQLEELGAPPVELLAP
jgi:ATP-dependent DNA ligase